MLSETISNHAKFAFYGAQVVAYGAYVAIKHLLGRSPECFIVSNHDNNPREIEGLPVVMLEAVAKDTLIIISVTELLQDEIADILHSSGHNAFRLTAHEEHMLMSAYFASIGEFPLAEKANEANTEVTMFQVRHYMDVPLENQPVLEPWEVSIQAGAELTDIRICEILDNEGNNISLKNKQYCEASVMYWVWKNASCPWVGIEHYRRRLLVCPEMLGHDVDAVLPLPYICYPNALTQFRRFVSENVIYDLLGAINMLYPCEYESIAGCLNSEYLYAYNLVAARKSTYSDYCEWAFNITEYIESQKKMSIMDSRALAYIVEMLTSLYFMSNEKNIRIKHAEKAIYK